MITSNVLKYLECEHLASEEVSLVNKRRFVLICQRHGLHEQLHCFDTLVNLHVQSRSVVVSEKASFPFRSGFQVAL